MTPHQQNKTIYPSSLEWIKRLSWLQILIAILLMCYFIFLAVNAPPNGWGTGKLSFIEDFHVGSLEQLTGKNVPIKFNSKDAGYYSGPSIVILIANAFILLGLKIKKLWVIRFGIILNILLTLFSGSIPILGLIMFGLSLKTSTKEYF